MTAPIICFGQQPCGFFPKRFLYAKIQTALRLQSEIGGEIVYFFHDSDHDPRETRTLLRHLKTGEPAQLNFAFTNSIQRKFSPLYLKEISAGWQDKTARQLPNYVSHRLTEVFQRSSATNAADFCLEIYQQMGLLNQIRVVRSSAPDIRQAACQVPDFFVDVPHQGEIVRARLVEGALKLHAGGDSFVTLPADGVHQPTNQSHPRYPVSLDAVGRALQPLHSWRRRNEISTPGANAGNYFYQS